MHARRDHLEEAQLIFDVMVNKNEVSWNSLIVGYARKCHTDKAFRLFSNMLRENVEITHFTYSSSPSACASIGSLEQGRWVRALVIKRGEKLVAFVGNTLLDMYAKSGSIEDARKFLIGTHVLLYNVYALAGRWNDAAEARKMRGAMCFRLWTSRREAKLQNRSEKLALAFALLNALLDPPSASTRTSEFVVIFIHFKFVSKMVERKITIRVTNRFHHFRDGACSCGDTGSAGYQGITKWLLGNLLTRSTQQENLQKETGRNKRRVEREEIAAGESAEQDQERLSSTGSSQFQAIKNKRRLDWIEPFKIHIVNVVVFVVIQHLSHKKQHYKGEKLGIRYIILGGHYNEVSKTRTKE
ncbi:hypothetical protein NC652_035728 [Populus alba x Populus x berolinensis]|nr:hypothetical protein NC652_035728 [Populus alba x Populus x berolinensis]